MLIAVDFDGTIVQEDYAFDDVTTPLTFIPGAKAGLIALKDAGHLLILWSTRANLALRHNWKLNPMWRQGILPLDEARWKRNQPLHEARYQQMLEFIAKELPRVFDAVDDGTQGKPTGVVVFLDDKAFGSPRRQDFDWSEVVRLLG